MPSGSTRQEARGFVPEIPRRYKAARRWKRFQSRCRLRTVQPRTGQYFAGGRRLLKKNQIEVPTSEPGRRRQFTRASGIGAETARQLVKAAHGANSVQLFIAAREEDKGNALSDELVALGAAVEYRSGDLTDPNFSARLTADCVSRFGRLDGLFNVAGISGRRFGDGPVQDCTEEGWAITINTNLTTQYRMCREAVRIMLKQGGWAMHHHPRNALPLCAPSEAPAGVEGEAGRAPCATACSLAFPGWKWRSPAPSATTGWGCAAYGTLSLTQRLPHGWPGLSIPSERIPQSFARSCIGRQGRTPPKD